MEILCESTGGKSIDDIAQEIAEQCSSDDMEDMEDGYRFMGGYTAGAGTLTESGGKYSLTMPEGNVTISAKFAQLW